MSHSHTAGPLKQLNKKHKNSSGKSKRSIKQGLGGKVQGNKPQGKLRQRSGSVDSGSNSAKSQSKLNRLNLVNQTRKNKRNELLVQKRLGSIAGPPRVIVLIPLTESANTDKFLESIISQASYHYRNENSLAVHVSFTNLKAKCLFLQARSRNCMECLDLCQVADIVLFVSKEGMVAGELIDEVGHQFLSTLKSFGLPSVFFCLQTDEFSSTESHSSNKINFQKFVQREYDHDLKVYDDTSASQLVLLCRNLTSTALHQLHWRSNRSYMISNDLQFVSNPTEDGGISHHVRMSGYLRAQPMNVNSLLHIVGCGTHRLLSIEMATDNNFESNKTSNIDHSKSRIFADISKQDSLQLDATPDLIMGEQTWPSEEEVANKDVGSKRTLPSGIELPNGMSSYQADWLIDETGEWQENSENDEDEEGHDDASDEDNEIHNKSDRKLAKKKTSVNDSNAMSDAMNDEDDDVELNEGSIIDGSIAGYSSKKSKASLKDEKKSIAELEAEDREFPDELNTPHDMNARDRFARFRALQSFRSSPWHPKENLPAEYNRIFQFENFNGTQKRILEEGVLAERKHQLNELQLVRDHKHRMKASRRSSSSSRGYSNSAAMMEDDNIDSLDMGDTMNEGSDGNTANITVFGLENYIRSGQYVTVTIEIVTEDAWNAIRESYAKSGQICQFFSLLRHENKLSVLNFNIQRTDNYLEPIKSKEELLFQVGFRRYATKPVFSESNLNSDKHRADRFFRHGTFSVASCFGPINYSPCPLLVFKKLENGELVLVATGSLLSVNPDRIILKRVILTGFPIRVRKKFAVVKHMFYNREDVLWYKPAELATKNGLRGHITETVGTHGLYKSQFSAPINQNDTVMLVLYKRIFPKFPENGLVVA